MGKKPYIIEGGLAVDDRGSVAFVNNFDFSRVKRFYVVENHKQGFVRAWHGHEREEKYAFVSRGAALFGLAPLEEMRKLHPWGTYAEPNMHTLSSKNPEILYIPAGYANGFKTLTDDAQIFFFSTSTLEESANDDIRFPYGHLNIWEDKQR